MILSDALSRRADAEDSIQKNRETTLLPSTLFVNLLEKEFADRLAEITESEYDPTVLERLRFLLSEPDADEPDWTITFNNGNPILFYKE